MYFDICADNTVQNGETYSEKNDVEVDTIKGESRIQYDTFQHLIFFVIYFHI